MNHPGARFVEAVRQHADTVLAQAGDRWGPYATPLLADGLDLSTREPVTWQQHGRRWLLSNPASQQNFLRVLIGLGRVAEAPHYIERAHEITRYTLRHLRLGGLLWWGAHCSVDLLHKKLVFCTDGSPSPRHELERCFPFYELMHEVDAAEARRVIEATWDMHMRDWRVLSFNRHNVAQLPRGGEPGSIWRQPYAGGAFTSEYFTFMPAGIDLAYAAAQLSHFADDPQPRAWAQRLVARYFVDDAHPETGLPVYLYNASHRPARADGRPEREDRAAAQLGRQLGRSVQERSVWTPSQARDALYCFIALFELSHRLGDAQFGDHAAKGLLAFAEHLFDADDGLFHPSLTDGTRLTGMVLEHDGYFGARGTRLEARQADAPALLAFATGYRHAPQPRLWNACAVLMRKLKLGEAGPPGGMQFEATARCASSDPLALLALLALHEATGQPAFLALAERLGDNVIDKRLQAGLFAAPGKTHARIDALEPLALLHLAQRLAGDARVDAVPAWFGGRGRFHALFDGRGRTTDAAVFYD